MNTRQTCWIAAVGAALLIAGCAPTTGGRYYGHPSYETYDPYYNRSAPIDPYYGGTPAPYYDPYYDSRSHTEEHRDLMREHEEQHEKLEQKYDKAMGRLDRQEHQAEEKLNHKYGGNAADPRYQQEERKIDQKYDYKRQKVEHNTAKEHREGHQELERGHDAYHND
jgi:hypothetical protein